MTRGPAVAAPMSERQDMAIRIAEWLGDRPGHFSNVMQSTQSRDDGRPGYGYLVTFYVFGAYNMHCKLVVWSEKRLDFHMDINPEETWTRFESEDEFYSFAITAFHLQGPITKR